VMITLMRSVLARLGLLELVRGALGRSDAHGHALLIRLLPNAMPLPKGLLIEVGTTREKVHGQGSTLELARLAAVLQLPFTTVDMDPINTQAAEADLRSFPDARAVTAKGEDYLAASREPIVAAYLDAFDIDHGHHSSYRIDRYRDLLGVEISNVAAATMHRACVEALMPRMVNGGLIVIDDTWRENDVFAGKGALAVPLLLERGYRVVGKTKTAVALQRDLLKR
jgi:hypothetical protein